ncbi:MAG: hypothetical protein JJ896_12240 [Rhodothermales bacterium]|nr:hypothetical protein [Rhodothermales bacterium]MBO6780414.1 hypothetical protein [Rhodothermales bacterium]
MSCYVTIARNGWGATTLRLLMLGISCIALAHAASAQSLSSIQAAFVDPGIGTRQAAMGYAGTALTGVEGASWNPASVARLPRLDVSMVYIDAFGVVPAGLAHVGFRTGRRWGLAVGLSESGDDVLQETTAEVVAARRFGPLSVGLGGRVLRAVFGRNALAPSDYQVFDPGEIEAGIARQVQGDALGFTLAAGAQYFAGRAAFAVVVRNPLSSVTWNSGSAAATNASYQEGLPLELVVGAALPAGPRAQILMDVRPALDPELDHAVRVGAEWGPVPVITLRAGTERRFNGRGDDVLTAGFALASPGTSTFRVIASYAYASSFLGLTQQVGIRMVLR